MVIYDFGLLTKDEFFKSPADPVTKEGLFEKLKLPFLILTK